MARDPREEIRLHAGCIGRHVRGICFALRGLARALVGCIKPPVV